MSATRIQLLVFDGFSDWQTSLACHEAGNRGGLRVHPVAAAPGSVRSASGLTVIPEYAIEDVAIEDSAALVLPGGPLWEMAEIGAVSALLRKVFDADVPIAAIGSGILALAHAGLLAGKRHSGNSAAWIKTHCPGYEAEAHYVAVPAVTDGGIVTAAGPAIIDFAHELLKALDIVDEPERRSWLRSLKEGVPA